MIGEQHDVRLPQRRHRDRTGGIARFANDLEVGDCVEDQDTLNSADVKSIDCGEDHVFELIGKFDVDEDGDYPGETELTSQGDERCQGDIFEEYVGVPYPESAEVYANSIPPSAGISGNSG